MTEVVHGLYVDVVSGLLLIACHAIFQRQRSTTHSLI